MTKDKVINYRNDPVFLHKLLDEIPAIVYVNVYRKPGDLRTLRTVWSSRYAQKFIGLTREEIDAMGFSFFEKTFHPADLEIFNEMFGIANANPPNNVYTSIHRIKPITSKEYVWLYGHSVILDYNKDGTPRAFLNISFEINAYMNTKNQLTTALKEIGRLQHNLQCKALTRREREILCHISRGLTNKQISAKLFISESTVKTHRNNIIKKLKIKNSAALAAFAGECGMN